MYQSKEECRAPFQIKTKAFCVEHSPKFKTKCTGAAEKRTRGTPPSLWKHPSPSSHTAGMPAKGSAPLGLLHRLTCRLCPSGDAGVRARSGLTGEGSYGPRAVQRREEGTGALAGGGLAASELCKQDRVVKTSSLLPPPGRDELGAWGLSCRRARYSDTRALRVAVHLRDTLTDRRGQ